MPTKPEVHTSKTHLTPERRTSSDSASHWQERKILLVDSERDRQARIAILKEHGFRVYPALAIEQARTRCRPGAYDLIIVSADSNQNMAFELCDQIHEKDPKQRVLVMTAGESHAGRSDHIVSSRPERLLERVESLLGVIEGNSEQLIA